MSSSKACLDLFGPIFRFKSVLPLRGRSPVSTLRSANHFALPLTLSCCCGLALGGSSASADFVAYHERPAAWNAAVGEATQVGFDEIPLGYIPTDYWSGNGLTTTNDYAFQSVESSTEEPYGENVGDAWGLPAGTHLLRSTPNNVVLIFSTPIRAFSALWGTMGRLRMYCRMDGIMIGAPGVFDFGLNLDYSPSFIGFTSDTPFNRLAIHTGEFDSWRSYTSQFAWSTVPSPSAGPLLMMVFSRRRRSR